MNQTYEVKPGDTLYGISNQYGVSVTELANLNNVTASNLKVGQILKIPNSSGTNPNNMFMYTVQKGDSLWSIAKKYNTTVKDIMNLNNLTTSNLKIGQVLRIPETYNNYNEMKLPSYKNYVVKKGDNLYSIARNNNISVDTIIKDNSLSSNVLQIGQVLKIRANDNTEEIEECFGEDYNPNLDTSTIYIVKKGDSLYSIAKKFNTTVDSIKKRNNLTTNLLSIGQQLKI